MPRRRKTSELNLDSLMDALTNVVGILVIMLVLTTLDVSSAVQRIKRERPEDFGVSPMDVAQAQLEADRGQQRLQALREKAMAAPAAAGGPQLADYLRQIEALKAARPNEVAADVDPAELARLIEERTRKSQQLEQQLTQAQNELAQLKAQLDDTPQVAAAAPKVVNVPNPRAAPEGIQPVTFLCRDGRVLPFDPDKLKDRAERRLEFLLRPLRAKAGAGGEIDCQALVADFNKTKIADANFQVQLVVQNFNLYLEYRFLGGGETSDRISERGSKYQVALRRLDANAQYVQFWVWADSFDTYVTARAVSDQYDLLAGWQPYDANYQWRTPLGIKVACQGKPKPPPAKPTPPGQPPPPPPKPLPSDQID